VAETRKKFFHLLAVAGGTSDFLVSKDQNFEIVVALHTVIFEDRHLVVSPSNVQFFNLCAWVIPKPFRMTQAAIDGLPVGAGFIPPESIWWAA
jgi:hypothetical protein